MNKANRTGRKGISESRRIPFRSWKFRLETETILLLLLLLTMVLPGQAFAVSGETEIASGLASAAGILKNIGIAMAAVALAFTGVQALVGSGQDAVRLWPRILLILAALAALLTVPYIVRFGKNLPVRNWEPKGAASSVDGGEGGWGEFNIDSINQS